jgi:hypothetical protein
MREPRSAGLRDSSLLSDHRPLQGRRLAVETDPTRSPPTGEERVHITAESRHGFDEDTPAFLTLSASLLGTSALGPRPPGLTGRYFRILRWANAWLGLTLLSMAGKVLRFEQDHPSDDAGHTAQVTQRSSS